MVYPFNVTIFVIVFYSLFFQKRKQTVLLGLDIGENSVLQVKWDFPWTEAEGGREGSLSGRVWRGNSLGLAEPQNSFGEFG